MGIKIQSGTVTGSEIGKNKDGTKDVILLQCEITSSEDTQTVELMNHTGEDNNPPNGSRVTIVSIGEAFKVAIASDDSIAPITAQGGKRNYSTNSAGSVVESSIHQKNDGTIIITNDVITITLDPSGLLNIVSSGNSEISSSKTIIKNATDITGNLTVTADIEGININATTGYEIAGAPGVTGSFTTVDGKTVTVTKGLIVSIV